MYSDVDFEHVKRMPPEKEAKADRKRRNDGVMEPLRGPNAERRTLNCSHLARVRLR